MLSPLPYPCTSTSFTTDHKSLARQSMPMQLCICTLADTSSFGNLREGMVRDRPVCGISDNALRKNLLQESQRTLEKCMDFCRAVEAGNSQLKEVSRRGPDTVNYLRKSKKGKPQSQLQFRAQPKVGRNTGSSGNEQITIRDCKYCGWRHE